MPKGQYQSGANSKKMNRHKYMASYGGSMGGAGPKPDTAKRMDGAGAPAAKSMVKSMYKMSGKMKKV